MTKILIGDKEFILTSFQTEAELEKVVVQNYTKIFGENTYYFDLKKGIRHKKGDLLTIPDGYLIKFKSQPIMIIIENELSTHDPVNHIGLQFVKFQSALTDTSKYNVKKFLTEYLKDNPDEEKKLMSLLETTPYKDVSTLFDEILLDNEIGYAIIIDETTEQLERIVKPFAPEIIVLKKFQFNDELIYHVESDSYQQEYVQTTKTSNKKGMRSLPEIDTIVCPAQEDGFNEVFLKEHRWFQIRIHPSKIPKMKYLAMYESAPISAINYIGEIAEIKPYKNTGKYELVLRGPAQKLKTPIKLSNDYPNLAPQGPKYTIKSLFEGAKKLEDIFPQF